MFQSGTNGFRNTNEKDVFKEKENFGVCNRWDLLIKVGSWIDMPLWVAIETKKTSGFSH